MYKIFTRNWWREARADEHDWPNNLVPNATARKYTIDTVETFEDAIEIAKKYNETHKPGRLERKAEIMEIK